MRNMEKFDLPPSFLNVFPAIGLSHRPVSATDLFEFAGRVFHISRVREHCFAISILEASPPPACTHASSLEASHMFIYYYLTIQEFLHHWNGWTVGLKQTWRLMGVTHYPIQHTILL